jgi:hypothetical protein
VVPSRNHRSLTHPDRTPTPHQAYLAQGRTLPAPRVRTKNGRDIEQVVHPVTGEVVR